MVGGDRLEHLHAHRMPEVGEVTSVPIRTREVTTAAAASVVYASYQGVVPRQAMWSYTQAWRKPSSSARRHSSPASGQDCVGHNTVLIRGVVTGSSVRVLSVPQRNTIRHFCCETVLRMGAADAWCGVAGGRREHYASCFRHGGTWYGWGRRPRRLTLRLAVQRCSYPTLVAWLRKFHPNHPWWVWTRSWMC